MTRIFVCIVILASLFLHAPKALAWSDDVQGMLMPSSRGDSTMSDPETILENIEGSGNADSGDADSAPEWD